MKSPGLLWIGILAGTLAAFSCDKSGTPGSAGGTGGQGGGAGSSIGGYAGIDAGAAGSPGGAGGAAGTGRTFDAMPSDIPGVDILPRTMTFFATSIGNGASGGDLGGLVGADIRCQLLAGAAGVADRTFRAYLSAEGAGGGGSGGGISARDRIGTGPWFNVRGVMIAANLQELHTRGIEPANILDETGKVVPASEHNLFTGSNPDGTLRPGRTCRDWTSGSGADQALVGHTDRQARDWNSSQPVTCDEAGLRAANAGGRFYCFAID